MEKTDYQTSWGKLLVIFIVFIGTVLLISPLFPKSWGVLGGLIAQEVIIVALTLTINHLWVHQPLHFKSNVSAKSILAVNIIPIIFMVEAVLITFARNNIDNFKTAIIVAICAGVTEEITFRGILLPGALTHFSGHKGIWFAILISSAFFGMAHMVNLADQTLEATVLQGTNAFAMGIILAAIYLRTRSLIFPMLFHGINDYTSTIVSQGSLVMHNKSFAPFIIEWIIYLLVAIYLLRKSKTKDVYSITKKNLF
ncbi:CPBP family intramembrane glutamic endopeptidase [Lentilactobacillus senioris]|uniref:CPBP family intramembrane glutamic endopeptidase n=1 Tax=Lentilactobacillus senioris TaxID=931534 RepID=UPI003D27E06B